MTQKGPRDPGSRSRDRETRDRFRPGSDPRELYATREQSGVLVTVDNSASGVYLRGGSSEDLCLECIRTVFIIFSTNRTSRPLLVVGQLCALMCTR